MTLRKLLYLLNTAWWTYFLVWWIAFDSPAPFFWRVPAHLIERFL